MATIFNLLDGPREHHLWSMLKEQRERGKLVKEVDLLIEDRERNNDDPQIPYLTFVVTCVKQRGSHTWTLIGYYEGIRGKTPILGRISTCAKTSFLKF